MGTLEIRQEIAELIKNEDDSSIKKLYTIIKQYKEQYRLDKMIAEGEEDIKAGRVYSQTEVKKMIHSWIDHE